MDYSYDDLYYYEQYDEDDDQYSSEEATVGTIPTFVSEPQHILVNEGDTFNIHCMVDKLGKRGDQVDSRPIPIIDQTRSCGCGRRRTSWWPWRSKC